MHRNIVYVLGLILVLIFLYCIINREDFTGNVSGTVVTAPKSPEQRYAQRSSEWGTEMTNQRPAEKVMCSIMKEDIMVKAQNPASEFSDYIRNEIQKDPKGFIDLCKQLLEILDNTSNVSNNFISSLINLSQQSADINTDILKSIPKNKSNNKTLEDSDNKIKKLNTSVKDIQTKVDIAKMATDFIIKELRDKLAIYEKELMNKPTNNNTDTANYQEKEKK